MPNQLYEIASATPENKHLAREWALVECALHQAAETGKSSSHICSSRHKPDLVCSLASSAQSFKNGANEHGIDRRSHLSMESILADRCHFKAHEEAKERPV